MGKRQKDMCPFSYWRAREGNSEGTGVVNVIKVWRQKDICMGKSQKDMCPFRYCEAREENSECTGKFHQSPETKKNKAKRCFGPLARAQSHQRHELCTRISKGLGTQTNSNSDTSQNWSRIQTVTHPSIIVAHSCLTSVSRQILITLRHNSRKSGDKKKQGQKVFWSPNMSAKPSETRVEH